ncbi:MULTISPECIES: helix-hairpin-helix domain-containing protein [Thermoanaerobacterium]|uniref:Competence protein ComEA helix-hairpin-helix repeat protein n=1 Tax=Thermoanaerobacterium xylanolyticum (strain ATCC 49914 / DSM 7097 / LX-11) TaxID=858215 RepID=F6BHA9_THEXL|nr:helix-hairpin-helix domain-containing protein [Thermoanaerobacterium xylanolyticum]AEF17582.1 competence protein ComEA helix-hairpin-helix repeat protein [Thermoanaerobacterium xylanolyticum LX-11]
MFKLTKSQQYGIIVLLIIASLLTGYFVFERSKTQKNDDIVNIKSDKNLINNSNTGEPIENEKSKEIKVYVTGLVKSPGVYTMKEGDRIDDAIKLAGGPLDDADLSDINLAEKLKDEQMIKVPKIGENDVSNDKFSSSNAPNGKININTATKEELDTLPGIGEVTAQRIIDFREQHGNFQRIEDIMNVSRIGPKLFEQIKDKITVN